MGSPADSAVPASGASRRAWSRGRKVFAVVGALLLVFVCSALVYGYLNGLPPQVVSSGGEGRTFLDVPLMTFYTPSIPGATDFNVTLTVNFAAGEIFPFAWGNVTGTSLPVRFVMNANDAFTPGPANGFVYSITAGPHSIGVQGPHPPGAYVSLWSMNYTVREMSAWAGLTQTTWLEVDYSLASVSLDIGAPLPVANVSVPDASDLRPTGIVDNLDFTVQPGYLWPLEHSIYDVATPWPTFRLSLPAITFDTGGQGSFTASLTSSFQWAKGDNYQARMTFSGSLRGWLMWYWDMRFGSLLAVYNS